MRYQCSSWESLKHILIRTGVLLILSLWPGIWDTHASAPSPSSPIQYGVHLAPLDYYWSSKTFVSKNIDKTVAILKAISPDNIRISVTWGMLEPYEGQYDWHLLDTILAKIDSTGKTKITIRLYTSSPWGVKPSKGHLWLKGIPRANLPHNLSSYEAFLRQLIKRYKNRIKYWQIDNEIFSHPKTWAGTPDDYLQILKSAYQTIKNEDSEAQVILAGIAMGTHDIATLKKADKQSQHIKRTADFMQKTLQEGEHFYDILDLHLYWKYEVIPERIALLRSMTERLGYEKPIYVLETGGPDIRAYLTKEEFQQVVQKGQRSINPAIFGQLSNPEAQYILDETYREELSKIVASEVIKRYIVCFSEGVRSVHWLRPFATENGKGKWWDKMGLANINHPQIENGLHAFRLLKSKVYGLAEISKIDTQQGSFLFNIQYEKNNLYVAWSEKPSMISLPENWNRVKKTNALGRSEIIELHPERKKIEITAMPCFIEKT